MSKNKTNISQHTDRETVANNNVKISVTFIDISLP